MATSTPTAGGGRKAPKPAPGTVVIAVFDFTGVSQEDLPFRKGDVLTIEQTSEDENWWLAKNAKGKTGMIPANYVEIEATRASMKDKEQTLPRDHVGPMPWFHGKISREEVNKLLINGKHLNGTYLVRESTNFPGDYTLCVYNEGQVDHYHIQSRNGKISVDDEVQCDSLDKLIKHYEQDKDGGLSHPLTKPLLRQGGKELKVDRKSLEEWEIPAKSIIKGTQLGSGQFGEVFEGTHQGKKVAIKTLKNVSREAVDEFLAEAKVMTKLKHANLVQLIGVVTQGDEIMLVTEFMSKGNLLDFLRSRGRAVVSVGMQLQFAKDICSGMAYLEKEAVVHRDLAARNVLIAEDNSAKVADFGLAKESEYGDIDSSKLPIKWTAPEVLRQKVSTSKSDVWSFGVTLWEIFSFGRSPYPRMSQKEVVEKITQGYRMEKPEECSDPVYDVMQKCWLIAPLDRPTFKSLKKLLDKIKVQP